MKMGGGSNVRILMALLVFTFAQSSGDVLPDDVFCRDSWFTNLSLPLFSQVTCAKCYVQTFFDKHPLTIEFPPRLPMLLHSRTAANVTYDVIADRSAICADTLSADECAQWTACCDAALHCCEQQEEQQHQGAGCPATWDGVGCWPATPPHVIQTATCPRYYTPNALHWLQPVARKECDGEGNWAVHHQHGQELTDYNDCFDTSTNVSILTAALYINLIGNSISIVLLLMAIVIISASRTLRVELLGRDSVRIHFNLFFSMLFLAICNVIMDAIFLREGLKNIDDPSVVAGNVWCKVVHVLAAYFRSATYMCMFCEGLYLYKRISNVMKVGIQDGLAKYYVISWVLPTITITLYCIVRFAGFDTADSCVAEGEHYYLELIHIIPNLISLASNFIFLISIEFMLCTKLRSDTTDRRVQVLRHALRATLSLIPIFGVQFLFIIYRPAFWPPYEVLSAVFTSSQGALVAILYCFTNKDVKEEFRNMRGADLCCCCSRCCCPASEPSRRGSRGLSLQSQSTKASRLSLPRYSVDLVQTQGTGASVGAGGAVPRGPKRVCVKVPVGSCCHENGGGGQRNSLADVITATSGKYRRESAWSTLTTNTVVHGSGRSLTGSGRSLTGSGRSLTGSGRSLPGSVGGEKNSSNSSKRSSGSCDVLLPDRPHSLEMMEMFEPLMFTLNSASLPGHTDAASLTDIEEEKTSQLSPIVEADV